MTSKTIADYGNQAFLSLGAFFACGHIQPGDVHVEILFNSPNDYHGFVDNIKATLQFSHGLMKIEEGTWNGINYRFAHRYDRPGAPQMHNVLRRLRHADMHGTPGFSPEQVIIDRADLRTLLFHFDRLDGIVRLHKDMEEMR